jgi:hypothetical protein
METYAKKHSNYSSSRRSEVDAYGYLLLRTSIACLTQTPGIDTNELYRGTAWRVMYSSMDRSGPM